MKKTILSLVALSAIINAQTNGIDDLQPLTDLIPQASEIGLDKISFGGYGKIDYVNNIDDKSKTDTLDMYRFIMYIGYQFSDNIKLVSEIEWEHGGEESTGGYGIIEQAYLDFKINKVLSIKAGHIIVPMGMVNLYHEPTAFNAVARPEVEKYIIPSTWHENGVIAHGKFADFSYQAGILAGFNAEDNKDIRSMRQNGQKSKAEDFGFVARLDYNGLAGFNIGGSFYTGNAGQGVVGLEDVSITIAEAHASYNYKGFTLRGLYAMSTIDNGDDIVTLSIANGSPTGVATEAEGYYINASYTIDEWTPFVRYEAYNDKKKSYDNTATRDDKKDDIINTTIGINYKPTPNVVIKANYVLRDNRGVDENRFELGLGYSF